MDVRLPKLGEGAESGTVVSVMVKEGDAIAKGQTILELENEKAVAPIPSTVSGKVTAVRVKEGDKISVGQVLLTVAEGGGAKDKASPASTRGRLPTSAVTSGAGEAPEAEVQEAVPSEVEKEEAPEEPAPPTGGSAPAASPSIRKMARE